MCSCMHTSVCTSYIYIKVFYNKVIIYYTYHVYNYVKNICIIQMHWPKYLSFYKQLELRVVFAIGESRRGNTWDQSDQP